MKVKSELREVMTDTGLRPFTDVFVEVDGRKLYSRHYDHWSKVGAEQWAKLSYEKNLRDQSNSHAGT